jgi:hypothetical protein
MKRILNTNLAAPTKTSVQAMSLPSSLRKDVEELACECNTNMQYIIA